MSNQGVSAMALLLIFTTMGDFLSNPLSGTLFAGVNAGLNMLSAGYNASTQHKYAMKQMAQQQKYQLEQMQMQDKYNKGFQQMLWNGGTNAQVSGLRNAGLNPAGASSSIGAQTAGNSVSTGTPNANGANPGLDLGGAAIAGFDAFSQYQMAKDKNDAEVGLLKAQKDKTEEESGKLKWENSDLYRLLLTRGMDAEILKNKSIARLNDSETELQPEKRAKLIFDAYESFTHAGLNADLAAKAAAETDKVAEEIRQIAKEISKADAEIALLRVKQRTEKAIQKYYNSAAGYNDALKDTENFLRGTKGMQAIEDLYNTKEDTRNKAANTKKTKEETFELNLDNFYRAYVNRIIANIPPEMVAQHIKNKMFWQPINDGFDDAFHLGIAGGAVAGGFKYGSALGGPAKSAVKVGGYGQ